MKGVLFLDFDGVLNTPAWCRAKAKCMPPPAAGTEFEPSMVAELNRILAACDLGIVVSSSWRLKPGIDLVAILQSNGVDWALNGIWA